MNNKANNLKLVMSSKRSKEENNVDIFREKIRKHQKRLFIVGGATIILSIAYFFYQNNKAKLEKIAQTEMFESVILFENGSYTDAINGTESNTGLLDISKKYNGTPAANLANFYIGASYLNLKDYDSAIEYLKKVLFKDSIMQARVSALIGDAYAEKGEYKSAVSHYENAANTNPNKSYSPIYLEKAAIIYEISEDKAGALQCYETISHKYPGYENSIIIKHIERLKASI